MRVRTEEKNCRMRKSNYTVIKGAWSHTLGSQSEDYIWYVNPNPWTVPIAREKLGVPRDQDNVRSTKYRITPPRQQRPANANHFFFLSREDLAFWVNESH